MADQQVARRAELDPFEDCLFALGRVFLSEEAVVRASRHDLWLFELSLASEPTWSIVRDFERCGWHIRLKLPKEIAA